jgi:hypothetical protein
MRATLAVTGWGRARIATRDNSRGHSQRVKSLVPTDIPQLVQRPPDSVLLERQFRPPAGLDSFNVNDEIRLLYVTGATQPSHSFPCFPPLALFSFLPPFQNFSLPRFFSL